MDPVYPAVSTPRRVAVSHGSGENTSGAPLSGQPISPLPSTVPPPAPTPTLTPNSPASPAGRQPTTHLPDRQAGNPQPVSTGRPEIRAGPAPVETAEIEIIPESPEISPELAEHVERVTRGEIELPGPIEVGVHEGRPVTIQPAASQQPNIVLPLTRADFTAGPGQPVASSWRWLYEWVKRVILMFPGRTVYNS